MIVNVRGANGSGKSTLVRQFLQTYSNHQLHGLLGPRRPEAYRIDIGERPLFLLGPYLTPTGGVDSFSGRGFDAVIELLNKYHEKGHLLFEGVLISTSFGAVGEWLSKHPKEAIVAFLDTPMDVCIESIKARTGESGTFGRVEEKIKALVRVKRRMAGMGMRVETITRENGFESVRSWFK